MAKKKKKTKVAVPRCTLVEDIIDYPNKFRYVVCVKEEKEYEGKESYLDEAEFNNLKKAKTSADKLAKKNKRVYVVWDRHAWEYNLVNPVYTRQ